MFGHKTGEVNERLHDAYLLLDDLKGIVQQMRLRVKVRTELTQEEVNEYEAKIEKAMNDLRSIRNVIKKFSVIVKKEFGD